MKILTWPKMILPCALLLGLVLMSSCSSYEERGKDSISKLISITQYNSDRDFFGYATFAVCDSMIVMDEKGDTAWVKNKVVRCVKEQVISEMTAAGYKQIEGGQTPDLYVLLSGVKSVTVNYTVPTWGFYNPYYWGGYPYYGWGYYYPTYPMVTSAYTSSSVIMEMVDVKNANTETKKMEIVWVGLLRGLMTSEFSEEDIKVAVADCFAQTNTEPFNKR